MPNLHSHAFQRAMAGLTERAGPEGDSFWRWREVMYRFLAILTPDDVEAIAAQLYVECLLHGYTSVAEFHYLHNAPDGSRYADPAELAHRIVAAAQSAGIGLTLLPVLYRRSQFGGASPTEGQRRFVLSIDDYAGLCETMARSVAIGIAPHSLRAVTPAELDAAIGIAAWQADPHPRRRTGEGGRRLPRLERCAPGRLAAGSCAGRSPLVPDPCDPHGCRRNVGVSRRAARWRDCARRPRRTSATASFPCANTWPSGGRFGIGSDSNVCTSPVEELRWLEYIRRLETRTRNVTETRPGASVALNLYRRALAGGAQALGRNAGAIEAGRLADLVVLDTEHPALVGRGGDGVLDAWLFSGNSTPVRDVMVAGTWVVRDGRHRAQAAIAAAFARTMRRLADML